VRGMAKRPTRSTPHPRTRGRARPHAKREFDDATATRWCGKRSWSLLNKSPLIRRPTASRDRAEDGGRRGRSSSHRRALQTRTCATADQTEPELGQAPEVSRRRSNTAHLLPRCRFVPLARRIRRRQDSLQCGVLDKHAKPSPGSMRRERSPACRRHINGRAALEGTMLGQSIFRGASPAAGPGGRRARQRLVGKPKRSELGEIHILA